MAFYDTEATTGVLLQGLNDDMVCVQNATGEKVLRLALCLFAFSCRLVTSLHCTCTVHLSKNWFVLSF